MTILLTYEINLSVPML